MQFALANGFKKETLLTPFSEKAWKEWPTQACKIAVERIAKKHQNLKDLQVGFIALNKQGEYGGYCLQKGFNYALYAGGQNRLVDPEHLLK